MNIFKTGPSQFYEGMAVSSSNCRFLTRRSFPMVRSFSHFNSHGISIVGRVKSINYNSIRNKSMEPFSKEEIFYAMANGIAGGRCGICEKEGGKKVAWESPSSFWAHSKCVKQIAEPEKTMKMVIDKLIRPYGNYHANMAHSCAIKKIKEQLGEKTILCYLNENGSDKLKEIFDNYSKIGIVEYIEYCKTFNPKQK